jgi:hypothetical protein
MGLLVKKNSFTHAVAAILTIGNHHIENLTTPQAVLFDASRAYKYNFLNFVSLLGSGSFHLLALGRSWVYSHPHRHQH